MNDLFIPKATPKKKAFNPKVVELNRIRFESSPLSYDFKSELTTTERELLVAALMLYFGEGAKTQTTVDLANSDPKVLKIFIKFLRDICRVDESRLRFYLYCFREQDPEALIRFWSECLKVSPKSFTKPYIRETRADLKRIMPYGVLHVRYSDKRLLRQIMFLIEKITGELS